MRQPLPCVPGCEPVRAATAIFAPEICIQWRTVRIIWKY